MERLIRISAVALSVLAFFGYTFLSSYYERFGIRLHDVPLDPSHIILRLTNLLTLRPELLALLTTAGLLILSCFAPAKIVLRRKTRPVWSLAAPAAFVVAVATFYHIKSVAVDFALRDINSDTSALRQLVCVNSGIVHIDGWVSRIGRENRKILIIISTDEKVVAFIEPVKPELPSPAVTVFELRFGKNALVAHSVSAVSIGPDARSSTCQV